MFAEHADQEYVEQAIKDRLSAGCTGRQFFGHQIDHCGQSGTPCGRNDDYFR